MLALIAFLSLPNLQKPEGGIRLPSGETIVPQVFSGPDKLNVVAPDVERFLVKAFSSINAPLVVDLPDDYVRNVRTTGPFIPILQNDTGVLERVSRATNRELSHSSGAYVVHRTSAGVSNDREEGSVRELLWLAKLRRDRPQEFYDLLNGGVDMTTLDPEGQSLLLPFWSGNPNSEIGFVSGVPVRVQIGIFPVANGYGSPQAPWASAISARLEILVPPRVLPQRKALAAPFLAAPDGKLDYGKGEVLTVGRLVAEASEAFNIHADLDSKFVQCPVFVKGSFTKPRMLAALNLLGTGRKITTARPPLTNTDVTALKNQVLRAALEALQGHGGDKLDYLQAILNHPGAVHPDALGKYGYKDVDFNRTTTMSLGLEISVSSDVRERVDPRTGEHRMMPVTGSIVID